MIETFQLPNIGYLIADLPDNLRLLLNQRASQILKSPEKEEPNNQTLVGHLEKEYKIHDLISDVEPFIMELVQEYEKAFNYLPDINILQKDGFCVLDSLWMNLQKKHEYNPVHQHSGIFSFVIWLAAPYNLAEEDKIFPQLKTYKRKNGRFDFYYTDILGRIRQFCVDRNAPLLNKICFFPSALNHGVYPFFTSDGYRVSVSGNVKISFDF